MVQIMLTAALVLLEVFAILPPEAAGQSEKAAAIENSDEATTLGMWPKFEGRLPVEHGLAYGHAVDHLSSLILELGEKGSENAKFLKLSPKQLADSYNLMSEHQARISNELTRSRGQLSQSEKDVAVAMAPDKAANAALAEVELSDLQRGRLFALTLRVEGCAALAHSSIRPAILQLSKSQAKAIDEHVDLYIAGTLPLLRVKWLSDPEAETTKSLNQVLVRRVRALDLVIWQELTPQQRSLLLLCSEKM